MLVSLAIRIGAAPLHYWKELYYCGWLSFSARSVFSRPPRPLSGAATVLTAFRVRPEPFSSVGAVLLLASVTDHGQICDRHMTVLGGVFVHAVLFHLLSFVSSFIPCAVAFDTTPTILTVGPTCSSSLTLSLLISQLPPSFAVKLYSLASSPS
jgi:hypothetical protein